MLPTWHPVLATWIPCWANMIAMLPTWHPVLPTCQPCWRNTIRVAPTRIMLCANIVCRQLLMILCLCGGSELPSAMASCHEIIFLTVPGAPGPRNRMRSQITATRANRPEWMLPFTAAPAPRPRAASPGPPLPPAGGGDPAAGVAVHFVEVAGCWVTDTILQGETVATISNTANPNNVCSRVPNALQPPQGRALPTTLTPRRKRG